MIKLSRDRLGLAFPAKRASTSASVGNIS